MFHILLIAFAAACGLWFLIALLRTIWAALMLFASSLDVVTSGCDVEPEVLAMSIATVLIVAGTVCWIVWG